KSSRNLQCIQEGITIGRRHQAASESDCIRRATVQPRHSQSRACGAFRCFAATFANKTFSFVYNRALPQRSYPDENSCKHDFHPNIFSG
ncbi:MAG: hypothetical protein IJZ34_11115, partial [Lachnospiraceae bacterium]|nr:hypothetical protein [Lachnospiraceae bacterium]